MLKPVCFVLCAVVLVSCGDSGSSAGNSSNTSQQTYGQMCFPGETKAQINSFVDSVVTDIRADDFGALGIAAKRNLKCSVDTAFTYIWSIYTSASAVMQHPIIDQDTAKAAFVRNWNNA